VNRTLKFIRRRATLVAVNAEAREAGLRVGQRLAAVRALLVHLEVVPFRCNQLHLKKRDTAPVPKRLH